MFMGFHEKKQLGFVLTDICMNVQQQNLAIRNVTRVNISSQNSGFWVQVSSLVHHWTSFLLRCLRRIQLEPPDGSWFLWLLVLMILTVSSCCRSSRHLLSQGLSPKSAGPPVETMELQCVEIQDTSALKVLLTHQLHLLKLQQLFSLYINQKDQAGVFILLPNVFLCFKIRWRFFLQDDDEDEQVEDDEEAFVCCHSDRHFLVLHQEAPWD